MTTVDSSVLIAAFASWHEHHREARRATEHLDGLVAHTIVETYSVLTRLPAPHRVSGKVVTKFLAGLDGLATYALAPDEYRALPQRLSANGVEGGATYDGLIAVTALSVGVELMTLDRRAVSVYERVGIDFRLLA